jgi:hypothetical protein
MRAFSPIRERLGIDETGALWYYLSTPARERTMNKRTTEQLTKQIELDDPKCQVTGRRSYGNGSYALDVIDMRTGVTFVVNSPEQWTTRMDDLRFDAEAADES